MHKPLKWLKNILNILPYIFFAIALLLIIQIVISLQKGSTPSVFGYSVFSVESPSMEPELMTGDLVFVKLVDPQTLEIGDIITFHQPGEPAILITHRIIDIKTSGDIWFFTTLGDNNHGTINDWEVDFSEEYVIGKVTSNSTFLGKLYSGIVSGGINIVYGIAIALFSLIGIAEAVNIVKEVKLAKNKDLNAIKSKLLEEELIKLRAETEKNDQTNTK